MEQKILQLEQRIQELENNSLLSNFDTVKTFLSIQNIFDYVECISNIPANTPKTFYDQIKIYTFSGTHRLYVYNYKTNNWRYATLT